MSRETRGRTAAAEANGTEVELARLAHLRHVSDADRGIRRILRGKAFSYRDTEGRPIRDEAVLRRIRALAIPPAWTDVWICPNPDGHI